VGAWLQWMVLFGLKETHDVTITFSPVSIGPLLILNLVLTLGPCSRPAHFFVAGGSSLQFGCFKEPGHAIFHFLHEGEQLALIVDVQTVCD